MKKTVHLFDHNPPELYQAEEIQRLFCNRVSELKLGLEHLAQLASDGGRRKLYAIHGDSRIGKSHFVRKLLLDSEEKKIPFHRFLITANNLGSARALLVAILNALSKSIIELTPTSLENYSVHGADPEQSEERIAEDARFDNLVADLPAIQNQIETYARLVNSPPATYSIKRNSQVTIGKQASFGLSNPPFSVTFQSTEGRAQGEEWFEQYGPLPDQELVDIIHYAIDVITALSLGQRVLMVIDDLDLIDYEGKEGNHESALAINLLGKLAGQAEAIILATLRRRLMRYNDKNLINFCELRRLKDDHIISIYNKHVEFFHNSEKIFDDSLLQNLIVRAHGQVGLFLRWASDLWHYGYHKEVHWPMTYEGKDGYLGWVCELVDDLFDNQAMIGTMLLLAMAVKNAKTEIELAATVELTALYPDWIRRSTSGCYMIDPLLFRVLAERESRTS